MKNEAVSNQMKKKGKGKREKEKEEKEKWSDFFY